MNVKLDVCSDITPFESSNSTSPSHLPALAKTVSVAERAYDINPLALVVYVTAPFINRVPPGFHTFHKPVAYVTERVGNHDSRPYISYMPFMYF